jgi:hypothetical protein
VATGQAKRTMIKALSYPFAFLAGWVFNFIVDIQFFSGFAAGWLMSSKMGPYIESILAAFD